MSLKHVASFYIMCCPFGGAYWGCWLTGGPVGPGGPYGPGTGPVWGGYLLHIIKCFFNNIFFIINMFLLTPYVTSLWLSKVDMIHSKKHKMIKKWFIKKKEERERNDKKIRKNIPGYIVKTVMLYYVYFLLSNLSCPIKFIDIL